MRLFRRARAFLAMVTGLISIACLGEVPPTGPQDPGVDTLKIAFQSDRDGDLEIYVMDADGSNPINLTNASSGSDENPSWSPDGTKIAFLSDRDGDPEIYVMGADGSNPINLTNDPELDLDPSWSPDGTKIAFQSFRDGDWEIYVMDADGSAPINLTLDPADDESPSWSH